MARKRRLLLALLAVLTIPAALLPGPAQAATTWTTVATGLDSPRSIAFVDGRMLVTEAGHGGAACFDGGVGVGPVCIGPSGRISWIDNGVRTTLVGGLFSETARFGFDSEGPSGLAVTGDGTILAQISVTPQEVPAPPVLPQAAYDLGQKEAGVLISVHKNGTFSPVAGVGKFDFAYTATLPASAHQEIDSNPTGILAAGEGAYVADSGSNTLDRVGEDGQIRILFRDGFLTGQFFPHDSVPTCVVRTEDGLLVGELSGRVLNVHGPSFSVITNPLFTHITGCTSDRQGNVYFSNMFGSGPFPPPGPNFFTGSVVKYNVASGQATQLVSAPFLLPYGSAIGPDGNLYVVVRATCPTFRACGPATGGVIRITLPHEGESD